MVSKRTAVLEIFRNEPSVWMAARARGSTTEFLHIGTRFVTIREKRGVVLENIYSRRNKVKINTSLSEFSIMRHFFGSYVMLVM
jgi:hypothetical protein